ncbi:Nucleolar protein of 40 kDa [Borealophlyctis nickersoniae]|nr:Nucleolar protein of 40 kDa [Borealophlyctis nickersoniae]
MVKDTHEVLEVGDIIWVKVTSVDETGKVSLSMKYVGQSKGEDLDPNGVKMEQEKRMRESGEKMPFKKQKLGGDDAVVNFRCTRCGVVGHLPTDCRVALGGGSSGAGPKYDVLPDDPEQDAAFLQSLAQQERKPLDDALEILRKAAHRKKSKKEKKSKEKKKKRKKDGGSSEKKKKKHKSDKREKSTGGSKKRRRSDSESSSSSSSSECE